MRAQPVRLVPCRLYQGLFIIPDGKRRGRGRPPKPETLLKRQRMAMDPVGVRALPAEDNAKCIPASTYGLSDVDSDDGSSPVAATVIKRELKPTLSDRDAPAPEKAPASVCNDGDDTSPQKPLAAGPTLTLREYERLALTDIYRGCFTANSVTDRERRNSAVLSAVMKAGLHRAAGSTAPPRFWPTFASVYAMIIAERGHGPSRFSNPDEIRGAVRNTKAQFLVWIKHKSGTGGGPLEELPNTADRASWSMEVLNNCYELWGPNGLEGKNPAAPPPFHPSPGALPSSVSASPSTSSQINAALAASVGKEKAKKAGKVDAVMDTLTAVIKEQQRQEVELRRSEMELRRQELAADREARQKEFESNQKILLALVTALVGYVFRVHSTILLFIAAPHLWCDYCRERKADVVAASIPAPPAEP